MHIREPRLPADYSWTEIRIDSALTASLTIARRPPGSAGKLQTAEQALGVEWLRTCDSVGLQVPSAIIPTESNLLLNPHHPQFAEVEFLAQPPFHFDPRLFKTYPRSQE